MSELSQSVPAVEGDGAIRVIDSAGGSHRLAALDGWRVMEIIRDHGLPIAAECGGAGACATCHVHVDAVWAHAIHPAQDDEEDMLDSLAEVDLTSRLACQIIWTPALDGLVLRLPGDASGQSEAA